MQAIRGRPTVDVKIFTCIRQCPCVAIELEMSFIIHSGHKIPSLAEGQVMATRAQQLEPTSWASREFFSGGNCRGIQVRYILNMVRNGWNGLMIVMVWDMHAKTYRHTVILKIVVQPHNMSRAIVLYKHFISSSSLNTFSWIKIFRSHTTDMKFYTK